MRDEVFAKPSHFPREIRASRGQTKKSARRVSRSGELSPGELLRIESCRQLYPKKRARILSSELEAGISSSDTAAICSPHWPCTRVNRAQFPPPIFDKMDNLLFESIRKSLNINLFSLKEIFESYEVACTVVHKYPNNCIFSDCNNCIAEWRNYIWRHCTRAQNFRTLSIC